MSGDIDKTFSFDNGKYKIVKSISGKTTALRHNEFWQDLTGNNLIFWMLNEIEDLQNELEKVKKLAKKTQDQKEFENFISFNSYQCFDLSKREWKEINEHGIYKDNSLQFGFECWMESKRLQKEHAQG